MTRLAVSLGIALCGPFGCTFEKSAIVDEQADDKRLSVDEGGGASPNDDDGLWGSVTEGPVAGGAADDGLDDMNVEDSTSGDDENTEPPPGDDVQAEPEPPSDDAPPADPDPEPDPASDPDPEPDPDPNPVSEPCDGGTTIVRVDETIVVGDGETFDGECQRYRTGTAFPGGASSSEPLFLLEDGARLVNVVFAVGAADGVHTYGDVSLANVEWNAIGDDALTIKEEGIVEIDGGAARNADDAMFQINAPGELHISNFVANNAKKMVRQDGGTNFRVDVFIDACEIRNMSEAIVRTDSNTSTVTMTNTRYSNIAELFLGVLPGNVTTSGNQPF